MSGLGLAMIARDVPARMSGFLMGAYCVATGVSGYPGSVVANFARMPAGDLDPPQSLPLYTKLFAGLGWLAALGALVAVLLLPLPLMNRLSRDHLRAATAVRAAEPAAGRLVPAADCSDAIAYRLAGSAHPAACPAAGPAARAARLTAWCRAAGPSARMAAV